MTQVVVDAERRGALPPTGITPRQLQHDREQPTLPELRAAFGLHRLSRAIATCFCSQDLSCPSDRHGCTRIPEDPARSPEWSARVSHAVFRLLILGAALAGAYKEPLLRAMEHPDPEIRALPDSELSSLSQKQMAFLLQFAVCDLGATLEAQDAVFGPIAEWLLESILSDQESRQAMTERFEQRCGRAGFCISHEEDAERENCPVGFTDDAAGSHSDAHLVVWELMKMFWLVERVRPYGLEQDQSVLDRDTPCPPSTQYTVADENSSGPLESAVAVFFGMFRAEETILSTPPGRWSRLKTYPAVSETVEGDRGNEKFLGGMSVAQFFGSIFDDSGRPNHIDEVDVPVAPLEMKFFEYFLQRHLGLCLDCQAFREDELEFMERSFQDFTGTLAIFSHDDVEGRQPFDGWGDLDGADYLGGSEMLEKYPLGLTRSYQQRRL